MFYRISGVCWVTPEIKGKQWGCLSRALVICVTSAGNPLSESALVSFPSPLIQFEKVCYYRR